MALSMATEIVSTRKMYDLSVITPHFGAMSALVVGTDTSEAVAVLHAA